MLKCPHCGQSFSGYRKQRDYEALERGECVDCGGLKSDKEITEGRWRCFKCRERRAFKAAASRGTQSEAPKTKWHQRRQIA